MGRGIFVLLNLCRWGCMLFNFNNCWWTTNRCIDKGIRCDEWISVNLTRYMLLVGERWERNLIFTLVCSRNIILLIVNLVFDSLFVNIEKFFHSFECCFLRNLSRKLNSLHVGFPVSYSSHLDVLLTACPIFYLNHDKCSL